MTIDLSNSVMSTLTKIILDDTGNIALIPICHNIRVILVPVGGNIVPVNNLESLIPYIGAFSVILVTITVVVKKRRLITLKDNHSKPPGEK